MGDRNEAEKVRLMIDIVERFAVADENHYGRHDSSDVASKRCVTADLRLAAKRIIEDCENSMG
jgi:hypothetical protein